MKGWTVIIILLIGIALGISGMYFLPDVIKPYLPQGVTGGTKYVDGVVVAKLKKQGSLLLTVNTSQGALLATFQRKVDEIDLLVEEDDFLEFSLRQYRPFIQDPMIKRVRKGELPAEITADMPVSEPTLQTEQETAGEEQEKAPSEKPALERSETEDKVTPDVKEGAPPQQPAGEKETTGEKPSVGVSGSLE